MLLVAFRNNGMVCGTCVEWQFHHKIGPQAITSHYVRSSEIGTITLPTLGANTSVKTAAALHFAAGILNLACLVHPSKSKILPHYSHIYDESSQGRVPTVFAQELRQYFLLCHHL